MRITFRQAVGIFARTFAALSAAVLLAAQGWSWATSAEFKTNALVLGLAVGAAVVGALLAVVAAIVAGPATTRVEKSVRAFGEKLLGGIGVVAFNSLADVVAFGKLLPPLLIASAFAFAWTWLTYVEDVPASAAIPPMP